MTQEHAVIAPSNMPRTVPCPGNIQAQALYDDEESEEKREGTAAHWVGSEVLLSWKAGGDVKLCTDFIDVTAPNGVVITDEMVESAAVYVKDVLDVCQADGLLRGMFVEHRVSMADSVHPLNWGTLDCGVWNLKALHLIVWDFKHGRRMVEAEGNYQGIDYITGLLPEVIKLNGLTDQIITVEFRIVQPRAYHIDGVVRSWTVPASDLRGYMNIMAHASALSQQPNPPTSSGAHCIDCTARRACVTFQKANYSFCDFTQALQLHDLTPAELGTELQIMEPMLKLMEARVKALNAQALEMALKRVPIPGKTIDYGRGSKDWNKPVAEVIALGEILGVDFKKPDDVITPINALKLKVDSAVINDYIQHNKGSVRLVNCKQSDAERVFGKTE